MHDKNPYKRSKPDFRELAHQYESFGKKLKLSQSGENVVDWTDSDTVRQVTQILMLHDFGVYLELPDNRLCPPVPNRMNYICWLSDLIEILQINGSDVHLVDIGVGVSVIYPFLGHKTFQWKFLGSDIDFEAVQWASMNVRRNQLNNFISIAHVDHSNVLQSLLHKLLSEFKLYPRRDQRHVYNSNDMKSQNQQKNNNLCSSSMFCVDLCDAELASLRDTSEIDLKVQPDHQIINEGYCDLLSFEEDYNEIKSSTADSNTLFKQNNMDEENDNPTTCDISSLENTSLTPKNDQLFNELMKLASYQGTNDYRGPLRKAYIADGRLHEVELYTY